ncbi:MAG: NADH dehydrogenase [Firmicutes bacterium]|nr:NADH dehydrogenase [Bacillota bacterium]
MRDQGGISQLISAILSGRDLAILVFAPIIAGLAILALPPRARRHSARIALVTAAAGLAASLSLLSQPSGATLRIPRFLAQGIILRIDSLSMAFALTASVVWTCATLFALDYLRGERAAHRFFAFWLLTLGACQGVFASGDLFTLFLFFETMTLVSYALVVHEESRDSMDAGALYINLGIGGGLLLLGAIASVYYSTGDVSFAPSLEAIAASVPYVPVWIAFFFGFGIKMGMVPLHFWLPRAHPVAPGPASAVLSGILIKTGAYGLLRVSSSVMNPSVPVANLAYYREAFGLAVTGVGILTALTGSMNAMLESDSKRLLAHSSVSQMGYVLFAIGIASAYPAAAPYATAAAILQIICHAVYKSALFMMASASRKGIFLPQGEAAGPGSRLVLTAPLWISALGLASFPGFGAFGVKVLLHHAAAKSFVSSGLLGHLVLEIAFVAFGAAATWYALKLTRLILLEGTTTPCWPHHETPGAGGSEGEMLKGQTHAHRWLASRAAFSVSAVLVLALGFRPDVFVRGLVIPAMLGISTDAANPSSLASLLADKEYFTPASVAIALAAAATGAVALSSSGRLGKRAAYWWRPCAESLLGRCVLSPCRWGLALIERFMDRGVNRVLSRIPVLLFRALRALETVFDRRVDSAYERTAEITRQLTSGMSRLEEALTTASDPANMIALDAGPGPAGVKRQYEPRLASWNSANLNSAAIILAFVLMLLLLFLAGPHLDYRA